MADYKRFVSYMYEYENGVKKKNVGYARVETRNGECRFTIHMQLAGLQEGIFPTYLIHRPADDMNLVYLGDCVVKNQVMDSRLNSKENNVMESGHGFSEMGGILLFLNSGVFYATQWDDKPVVLEEVLNALKSKTKAEIYYGDEDASKDKSADKKLTPWRSLWMRRLIPLRSLWVRKLTPWRRLRVRKLTGRSSLLIILK